MSDKLRECPFCGEHNIEVGSSGIVCHNCNVVFYGQHDNTIEIMLHAWNNRHESKHETVEQWEKRTGKTYPDDGPVWVEYRILKEDRIEWKLCILKDIKQWDHIASKYNIETSEISIVANHHGKPEQGE